MARVFFLSKVLTLFLFQVLFRLLKSSFLFITFCQPQPVSALSATAYPHMCLHEFSGTLTTPTQNHNSEFVAPVLQGPGQPGLTGGWVWEFFLLVWIWLSEDPLDIFRLFFTSAIWVHSSQHKIDFCVRLRHYWFLYIRLRNKHGKSPNN